MPEQPARQGGEDGAHQAPPLSRANPSYLFRCAVTFCAGLNTVEV